LSAHRLKRRQQAAAALSARLRAHIALEVRSNGEIDACFDSYSVSLGKFSADAADRVRNLRIGLPLSSFASERQSVDEELHLLVRRLARHGLLEYSLRHARIGDELVDELVIVEPQVSDYWPQMQQLRDADAVVLSRFAYMRRRGNEMVLESPRAGALFKICDPKIAAVLAILASPQKIQQLRRRDGFPGIPLLALLVDCQILFKTETANNIGFRPSEGDDNLVLWDFHDLVFHARSTEGRHANPLGGLYRYAGVVSPLPAVRPSWPGKKIDLRRFSVPHPEAISPTAVLIRERHSTRSFDDQRPISLAELSQFLDSTARVQSRLRSRLGQRGPMVTYAVRPYPSGGSCYELELYLAVNKCEGLARGFYHYDAARHALVPIDSRRNELSSMLREAEFAMGAPAAPQILITITARFGRVSWKYSSIAYALILKDVGVLIQTFYLMSTEMGLGGCAIGTVNIDLFAKMTGIEFHVEGPVGQFAIGRGIEPKAQRRSR
jgi:SagB-type dehydrogenase family enzyme